MSVEEIKKNNTCAFNGCVRKIKITDFSCKCEKYYCKFHKDPLNHNCSDDKKKKTSGEKYKDIKNKIKSVARDVFKADDAELGADIGKDFTDFADKFMKSNIRKK